VSTTTRVTSKRDLIAKIEHGYVASRAVLEALPAERWDEKLPAGWTLKEMAGHLGYWESTVRPHIEALRTGTARDSGGSADAENAKVAAEVRGLDARRGARAMGGRARGCSRCRRLAERGRARGRTRYQEVRRRDLWHYPDHFADLGAASRPERAAKIASSAEVPFRLR
jgi:hypothetical protein